MIVCSACGQENPDGFRFCGRCGKELAPAEAADVRKVVTVVFCDLTGSTALGHTTDPETLRKTMRSYYEEMRTILERHGGTVEKFIGDAVMAVFGVPVAHEDDALRAIRAAWEMRTAVPALGLRARIGVNTGEVVAGRGDSLVTGDAVNLAARLEQAADAGEVLIGAETQRLVRDAVEVEPVEISAKGKPDPVSAFRLVAVDPDAQAITRRLDAPLIGRRRELALLQDALARAAEERSCHLFTLLGPAGVGKSRLVEEFVSAADARVLRGRCLDYGEGITYWPVVEVLKQLGPAADAAIAAIAAGSTTPAELERTIRRLLESAADERPLIVVFDDVHWGEPTFLDLIDHTADLSRGAPILLLCLAREDLLEVRPTWGGGKLNASTVLLEPLSTADCEALIDSLGDRFSVEARAQMLTAAAGNPLFVEEMAALARDSGRVEVPSSIQALLQARLDRLGDDERVVIECGAVEGEVFHRGPVLELAPARTEIEENLVGLVRKELIRPERAIYEGDDAYRFRHLLMRDAAYDALPKSTRAELHERFAGWLEQRGGLIELDEIAGHHLEQAARYRGELGLEAAGLSRRAGERLADAGRRAYARNDLHAARNLLERSLALLPPGEAATDRVALDLGEAAEEMGDLDAFDRLVARGAASKDDRIRFRARLMDVRSALSRNRPGAVEAATAAADQIEPLLDDADNEAQHWLAIVRFWVDWIHSRGEAAFRSGQEAVRRARLAGDLRLERNAVPFLIGTTFHGPVPRAEAERILVELDERGAVAPASIRVAMSIRAGLAYFAGDYDSALQLSDRLIDDARELGAEFDVLVLQVEKVRCLRAKGDLAAAIACQEHAGAGMDALGAQAFRSTVLANLGRLYYEADRLGDAERTALEAEAMSAPEDVVNFAIAHGVRARILAGRGEHTTAEELALDAVDRAFTTDFPAVRGDALLDLAAVHVRAGRTEQARDAAGAAIAEYERKGDVFAIAQGRALLDSL